ncbi:hypothetical protein KPL78_19315 [Roseomonas sp. HJA6]|uniref:Uncharacterized protein n=1 Tax=Roseomonas alba TaxID=2846776 RepID=A0ABS7ACH6_9PROT|nr:hypothetical protein [Neoroseomonas alba]MBW6400019.1 hypothetical protein [Neoroseomonas alba]
MGAEVDTSRDVLVGKMASGMRTRLSVNVLRHAPQVGHGWLNELSVALAEDALAVVAEEMREPSEAMKKAAIAAFNSVPLDDRKNSTAIAAEIKAAIAASPLGGEP